MTINIDQADYVADAGDTAGIRVLVHNGNQMPFPEDDGLIVSSGHSTSVGLQKACLIISSQCVMSSSTTNKINDFDKPTTVEMTAFA